MKEAFFSYKIALKKTVTVLNHEFHKTLAEYQDNLIGNKKYTFEFKELPIEDIFGRVTDCKVSIIILIFFNFIILIFLHLNVSTGTLLFSINKTS